MKTFGSLDVLLKSRLLKISLKFLVDCPELEIDVLALGQQQKGCFSSANIQNYGGDAHARQ